MAEPLTRRRFVQRSGIAALATVGLYGLLDTVASAPARAAVVRGALPPEQHLMRGLGVISDNGIKVVMPPLHHQIVTARLTVGSSKAQLSEARLAFEDALRALEHELPPTPSGLGLSVGWGLPYSRRLIPALADGRRFPEYLPQDRRASTAASARARAARGSALRKRSTRDRARAQRRRRRAAERLAAPHRRGRHRVVRQARRPRPAHEHPQGLRRWRLCRRAQPPESDGDERRHPGCRADPRDGAAFSGLHLDTPRRARARPDRELRDVAGAHRPVAERLLPQRDGARPLAHLRGHRKVLDNPFFWTSEPGADAGDPPPAAGLHFAAFPLSELL